MALTAPERTEVWAKVMSDESSRRALIALDKNILKAAVVDVDNWVESNQVSYNNALSAAAQAGLTSKQKALILLEILRLRYEVT